MEGTKRDLALAASLLALPLGLVAAMIGLIYGLRAARNEESTYAEDLNAPQHPLGNAYYLHISSTRFTYISSLGSTIALALVPVVMSLLAYTIASELQKASDTKNISKLPSPLQFQLLITLRSADKSMTQTSAPTDRSSAFRPGRGLSAVCLDHENTVGQITSIYGCVWGGGGSGASATENFDCTAAGVNLTASLYLNGGGNEPLQAAGNTMSYYYFNEPEMQDRSTSGIAGSDYSIAVPHLYWAIAFSTATAPDNRVLNKSLNSGHDWNPTLGTVYTDFAEQAGIFTCQTDLYDVDYAWEHGTISQLLSARPMNATAAVPFQSPIRLGTTTPQTRVGFENLGTGLTIAAAQARSPDDFARRFATTFDETLLALASGTLQERPPISISQRKTTLVARIPRAPFLALVILECMQSVVGLVAVARAAALSRHGVRDTQVRLSIGGLAAELFEREDLNATAKCVDELFAERRGLLGSRVAVTKDSSGARRLTQIEVNEGIEEEQPSGGCKVEKAGRAATF
ncbi:MAG: hypothetical protein Q9160_007954 [Pyrenula sp. 1 TL-2023]